MSSWSGDLVNRLWSYVVGYDFAYSPVFLATSCAIAAVCWIATRPRTSFLSYLFPAELYRHSSSRTDLSMSIFNTLLIGVGGLSFAYFGPTVASFLLPFFTGSDAGQRLVELSVGGAILLLFLLVVVEDFCRYLIHFLHHKTPALWPFHAVHHSAEVLTPLTFFRAHPLYFILQACLVSILVGTVLAAFVAATFGKVPIWVFFGAKTAMGAYLVAGVHLRHSHIPFGYGRVLSHILISPHQHQVHHSINPRHRDRNFGEVFAVWDWLFGTLVLPEPGEKLSFGLTDDEGEIVQPYPTFLHALVTPFLEALRVLGYRRLGGAQDDPPRKSNEVA